MAPPRPAFALNRGPGYDPLFRPHGLRLTSSLATRHLQHTEHVLEFSTTAGSRPTVFQPSEHVHPSACRPFGSLHPPDAHLGTTEIRLFSFLLSRILFRLGYISLRDRVLFCECVQLFLPPESTGRPQRSAGHRVSPVYDDGHRDALGGRQGAPPSSMGPKETRGRVGRRVRVGIRVGHGTGGGE